MKTPECSNGEKESPKKIEAPHKLFKVAGSTDAKMLAGSIEAVYEQDRSTLMVLRTIGAASLNQATKAAIIANHYFSKKGLGLSFVPSFNLVQPNLTAIELLIRVAKI